MAKLIKTWLRKNRCNWDTTGTTPMTQTIMSGGKLFVPEDIYDEFLGVYAREIECGNTTLTYSEKRSEVFRMYFDLDIIDKAHMDDATVLEIARSVQKTAAMFFVDAPSEVFKCVVSRTKDKDMEVAVQAPYEEEAAGEECADGAEAAVESPPITVYEKFVKTGVHMNFPKLLVNVEMALQIRFSAVHELEKEFGPRKVVHNPWSAVIDKAPYYGGLKMVGSVKTEQCKNCDSSKKRGAKKDSRADKIIKEIASIRRTHYKKKEEDFDYSNVMSISGMEFRNEELSDLHTEWVRLTSICDVCNNKGWYLEDRTYSPAYALGEGGVLCDGDLSYIRRNFHEQMRWTSIRARPCEGVTARYAVPKGHLAPTADKTSTCLKAFGSAGLQWVSPGLYMEMMNADVSAEDAKGQSRWRGPAVKEESTMKMITQCVREFDLRYANIVVKEAVELKTGKRTDDTGAKISGGAGAGMTVKKKTNAQGHEMLNNLAAANNSTIKKDVMMRVYTSFVVRVGGEGSKFCQNKGAEHTTNSVYFCISSKGMCQMCHSGKDTAGSSGKTCKKFYSASKAVPIALRRRLFPDTVDINVDAVKEGLHKRGLADKKDGTKPKKSKKKNRSAIALWDSMC